MKLSTGCWTCRLRRKKCADNTRPCHDCRLLGIECNYGSPRPEWMDNGLKQEQRAAQVKAEIRQNATRRRTRQKIDRLARNLERCTRLKSPVAEARVTISRSQSDANIGLSTTPGSTPCTTSRAASQNGLHLLQQTDGSESSAYLQSLFQGVLLMAYFDHHFPIIYPHYNPALVEGGRCWLLPTVVNNSCLQHAVLALASHILSAVNDNANTSQQLCKTMASQQLQLATQGALQSAMVDLETLRKANSRLGVLECSKMFCSIVQLLLTEAYIGTDSWRLHLEAGTSLLWQMHAENNPGNNESVALDSIVNNLGTPFTLQPPESPIYTPDQAAFRFHTASLVFADVVASTSLEQEPRLYCLLRNILRSGQDPNTSHKINIVEIFGLENDTLLLIADISALAAWKKSQLQRRQLSMPDLVGRAQRLTDEIELQIQTLRRPQRDVPRRPVVGVIDLMTGTPRVPPQIAKIMLQIWVLAAKAYLFVTISGLQLSSTKLRDTIQESSQLIQVILASNSPSVPMWLRSLCWPLGVTGLLVDSEEDKATLLEVFRVLKPLESFATVRNLRLLVEGWWQRSLSGTRIDTQQGPGGSLASLLEGVLLI